MNQLFINDGVFLSFLDNPFFYRLFSVLFLTANTFTITFVLRGQGLIERRNYLPSLFYLLLSFIFPNVLSPLALFAGFVFIVGIIQNLFDFEENNINKKKFRYGFSVGILALIYFPFILLLLFVYFVYITYRKFSFRIFLLPILCALIPFLYWYSILYIIGVEFLLQENIRQMGEALLQIQYFNIIENSYILISTILLLLIGLKSIQILWKVSGKTSVLKRKKYYILLALLLFSTILFFLYSQFYVELFLIVYLIILLVMLEHVKKKWIYLLLFMALFLIALLNFITL